MLPAIHQKQPVLIILNWPNIEQLIGPWFVCTTLNVLLKIKLLFEICRQVTGCFVNSKQHVVFLKFNLSPSMHDVALNDRISSFFRCCVAWQVHQYCSGRWGGVCLCLRFRKLEITQPQNSTIHNLNDDLLFASSSQLCFI